MLFEDWFVDIVKSVLFLEFNVRGIECVCIGVLVEEEVNDVFLLEFVRGVSDVDGLGIIFSGVKEVKYCLLCCE